MNIEHTLSTELAELIATVPVGGLFTVAPSSDFAFSLELFIPGVLKKRFPEWELESLDGIFVTHACRTGLLEVEMYGMCILITDQTCTPFRVNFEIYKEVSRLFKYHVLIGEQGSGHLKISGPKINTEEANVLLRNINDRIKAIVWTFELNGETL